MEKLKWWQGGGHAWKINEAAAELQALDGVTDALAQQIGRLFQLDQDQSKEIDRVHVVIQVLIQQLVQAGALDETDLSVRIEAALDQLENPDPPATDQAVQGHQAAPMRTVQCSVCQKDVPEHQTLFTEMGQACPTCYENIS